MAGIVEGRIVGPEHGVEQFVFELRVVGQHQAPAIPGSAVEVKIEIGDGSGNAQLQGCNFAREMPHVVAAERSVGSAEEVRFFLLHGKQEAARLDAAEGEDEIASFYGTRAGGSCNFEAFDVAAACGHVEADDGAAQADLYLRGADERVTMNFDQTRGSCPAFYG